MVNSYICKQLLISDCVRLNALILKKDVVYTTLTSSHLLPVKLRRLTANLQYKKEDRHECECPGSVVTRNSTDVTIISIDVTPSSYDVTATSCDVTVTSCNVRPTSCDVTEDSYDVTQSSCDVTEVFNNVTQLFNNVMEVFRNVTGIFTDVMENPGKKQKIAALYWR